MNPVTPLSAGFAPTICTSAPPAGTNWATDPLTAWSVSDMLTGDAYDPVALPDTGGNDAYGYCGDCIRFFETSTCGVPTAVWFRWGSDNDAQLLVNGAPAYSAYWDPLRPATHCSGPGSNTCGYCCDSPGDCQNAIMNNPAGGGGWMQLADLSAFTSGTNTITWETGQGGGGMGFYAEMRSSGTPERRRRTNAPRLHSKPRGNPRHARGPVDAGLAFLSSHRGIGGNRRRFTMNRP